VREPEKNEKRERERTREREKGGETEREIDRPIPLQPESKVTPQGTANTVGLIYLHVPSGWGCDVGE
jgi:hypothetical protein